MRCCHLWQACVSPDSRPRLPVTHFTRIGREHTSHHATSVTVRDSNYHVNHRDWHRLDVLYSCSPFPCERTSNPFFMSSSTEDATSRSNFQLIVEAFADYAKLTGIDLSKSSFAEKLERSNSPHSILEMLQERENAFKEHRDQNRRLISCITPTVEVLHAFSAVLGEAVSLVSKI
jgi:hypothetical protein